jgi:hypothetical protein
MAQAERIGLVYCGSVDSFRDRDHRYVFRLPARRLRRISNQGQNVLDANSQ